jgi:WD40 repeat protein
LLLSTGKDKLVKIWDLGTGQLVRNLEGHTGDVAMADFSPDGKLVVSASADQSARVWEVATGKCKLVLKDPPLPKPKDEEEAAAQAAIPPPTMNWATFNADSTQVITASQDFALKIWELGKGKKIQTIQDDGCFQRSVYRRRDAKGWLSAAGCMDDGVTYLKFWDEAGTLQNTQGNETQDAHYLAYDRAGQFLATADGSVMLSIYSAQGSFLKKIMVGTYHFCLVFGPGDKALLVGTDGGEIFGYRPPAWERVGKLDVGEKVAVDSLALSPSDGSLVAALRNGKIIRFTTPVE